MPTDVNANLQVEDSGSYRPLRTTDFPDPVVLAAATDGLESLLTALGGNTDGIEALLTALGTNTDGVESLLAAIGTNTSGLGGFTDGIEALLAAIGSNTDGIEGFVDGLEGLLTTLGSNTDQIESLLTTLGSNTDGLEGFVDGLEGLLTTLGANTDGIESLLTTLGSNTDGIESLLTTLGGYSDGIESLLTAIGSNTDQIEGFVDGVETALGTLATQAKAEEIRAILDAQATLAEIQPTADRVRYETGKLAATATYTTAGDHVLVDPPAGQAVRLYWITAISRDPDNVPRIIVAQGSTERYRASAIGHFEVFEGAADEDLVVNLSGVGIVDVTAHYKLFVP